MRVAIASGKGGTGKTTVAVNLAARLTAQGRTTVLADCDVEEPNVHMFLVPEHPETTTETYEIPAIDASRCQGESCQSCVYLCRFKALIWMADEVMVFPELCHSCGLCFEACPADAIGSGERVIGTLSRGGLENGPLAGLGLVQGLMRVGEAMAPPLIKRVKNTALQLAGEDGIVLFDSPPGTSCPVIETLNDSDAAVLVTEPTPFGLHDLKLAVETLRGLDIPFGVVINRDGMGDDRVERYLSEEDIPLLARIPHSLEAAQAYSRGELFVEVLPDMARAFDQLWAAIVQLAQTPSEVRHA